MSSGLTFLYLFALPSAVWFILRKVTLRASSFQVQVQQKKKRASVCPRQSSNYDYSDWTSLGLGSLFNPSYLVGSCCALMGLDQLPAGVRSGSTGSKPIHQGGGAGPQKETESLVGIQEYRRRAAGNLQPRLLKITGRCPKSVMEQGQSQQSLEERWGC